MIIRILSRLSCHWFIRGKNGFVEVFYI